VANVTKRGAVKTSERDLLIARLDGLSHVPGFDEAAQLGVELVHTPESAEGIFHLANGDAVYPTEDGWQALEGVRTGTNVRSGDMRRIHNPGIDPSARIHPTARVDASARVEPAAVVGPHAVVGADAHVGRGAWISRSVYISNGAFVGANTRIRPGSIISEGAVIGAGSDIGASTRIGSGARVDQRTVLDAFSQIGAGSRSGSQRRTGGPNPSQLTALSHAVDRIVNLDR